METSSCGEVTMMMPSSGMDWNTVSGASPVPGGRSTNMQSTSFQITSLQNCLMTPAITGPRQTTGEVSSSSRRLMLMTSMPLFVLTGNRPSSQPCAFSCIPKHFGIDGPVTSASRIAVFRLRRCIVTASMDVTRLLPTPPLPLTIPMTFLTLLILFIGARKLSGCWREGQSSPQLEQSCVQFSLILYNFFLKKFG